MAGVCFLKRTRGSDQDTRLPVRKHILLLTNSLSKEGPNSRKSGFYVHLFSFLPSWPLTLQHADTDRSSELLYVLTRP